MRNQGSAYIQWAVVAAVVVLPLAFAASGIRRAIVDAFLRLASSLSNP